MAGLRRGAQLLLACALLLPGCRTERADRSAPAASADAGSTRAPGAVCLQGEAFVADGPVSTAAAGPGADARRVQALRWQPHDGCERFVIDLAAADGADARNAGDVRAEVLRDLGVVRVTLRAATEVDTAATDARFDGALAARAYTVRAADGGGLFVDLHLRAAAEAHVSVLPDPARVVVDLRPGGASLPPPAAAATRVVLLQPRGGTAEWPLEVSGYSRTFESNVVARIERNGVDVYEDFTTATSWLETWGHYSLLLRQGPSGPVTLHVGEYSARDGAWEGVSVQLNMR